MTDPSIQSFPVGGLDETNDDVFGPPTSMRACVNVVFPDGGTASTRPGLRSGAGLNYARKLFTHKGELLLTDGANAYSLYGSPPIRLAARGRVSPCIASRSTFSSSNVTTTSLRAPIVALGAVGFDAATGYQVRAWSDGNAIQAQVYEPGADRFVTGVVSLNDSAGTGTGAPVDIPHVGIIGSVAFVVYFDNGNPTHLYARALDLTNIAGGWGAAQALTGFTGSAAMVWDASVLVGPATIALVTCENASGLVTLNLYAAIGTSLSNSGSATVATIVSPTFTACAVRGNITDGIALAYAYDTGTVPQTTTLKWAAYDLGANVVQAPVTVTTSTYTNNSVSFGPRTIRSLGIERITGQGSGNASQWLLLSSCMFTVSETAGGTTRGAQIYALNWWRMTTTNSGPSITWGPIFCHQQMSKPVAISVAGTLRIYALVESVVGTSTASAVVPIFGQRGPSQSSSTIVSPGNQTILLCEFPFASGPSTSHQPPVAAAVLAPTFAGDLPPAAFDLALSGDGTKLYAVGTEKDQSDATSLTGVTFDFAHVAQYQTVRLGNWTWLAGGVPMIYDGNQLCEVGFMTPPPPALVIMTAAGAVTTNPTVQYVVMEVQQDADGNIHRSAPSLPSVAIDASAAGASQFDVYAFTRRITFRQAVSDTLNDIGPNPIRVQIYRNTLSTPGTFNLVVEIPNDPTTGLVHFVDTIADSTIASNAVLPTTGGVVESDPVPSLSALSVHADRVMGIGDDGRTMWFTTAFTPGECPRFSLGFTIAWPEGPITATWSLEQRLTAATADRTWYVLGEGPTDTASGVDWTTPQLWQPDLGVVDARGVALFERGAILSTKRGLYLEGRDGSMTWLTKPRRTLAAYPIVASILPLTSDGAVKIACNASPVAIGGGVTITPGVVLYWDYRHDKWSTHVTPSNTAYPLGADDQASPAGGPYQKLNVVLFNGAAAGNLSYETPSAFLDGGGAVWVPVTLTWGWFAPGVAMQGWGEVTDVQILARYATPHTLTVSFARDYSATADPNTIIWDDGTLTTNAAAMGGAEQVRGNVRVPQTSEAISISVAVTAPTIGAYGTGAGATFQSLLVRSTPKRGEYHYLPQGSTQ